MSQHEGSSDLPAWLQAVATIGLLGFAFWQMRLISRSTTATENAAGAAAENAKAAKDAAEATERYVGMTEQLVKATKQSADAAELALHIDRPFLLPDNFNFNDSSIKKVAKMLKDGTPALVISKSINPDTVPVAFSIKNHGKGPAVMNEVRARIAVLQSIKEIPIGDFSECEIWPIKHKVIGVGEEISVTSPILAILGITNPKAGTLTAQEQIAVVERRAFLTVYGRIEYTDLFEASFFVDFFWTYRFYGQDLTFTSVGPKERNRHYRDEVDRSGSK